MLHNQKKRQSGFTIIEVLIVLAIAGLIMLVVFLAVPALQRNSRNTQRKADVSAIVGALQEYVDNNAGKLPADNPTFQSSALTNAKLGFYNNAGDVVFNVNSSAVTTIPASDSSNSKVYLETYAKCNGNAFAANPSSRNVAAVYYVEGSGGNLVQCQDM